MGKRKRIKLRTYDQYMKKADDYLQKLEDFSAGGAGSLAQVAQTYINMAKEVRENEKRKKIDKLKEEDETKQTNS